MAQDITRIYYRIGTEVFVFRYRPEYYREAMCEVGLRAAEDSSFTWNDAAIVTQYMRDEHANREARCLVHSR